MFALMTTQLTHTARAAGKTVVVTMTDKPPAYVPEKLTVKAGTTVVWKNTAQSLHDVTTDPSMAQNKSDVALPPGASWSYTFPFPAAMCTSASHMKRTTWSAR